MSATRRAILLTGAAGVVILGAGWALTREPKTARAPWRAASEGLGDPRLDVLAYAVLAPNAHNMQPWRVRLDGEDGFTVYCDPSRLLPETDPPSRQITISFGCFLELARQAAAANGFRAEMTYFPEGEPFPTLDARPVASVRLLPEANIAQEPLFAEALARRTNRLPYDLERAVSEEALAAIRDAALPGMRAETISDASRVEDIRALTVDAWRVEWSTASTRRESIDVMRIGKKATNERPYGIAVLGAPVEALAAAGAISHEKFDEPGTSAYAQSLKMYEESCNTAMAYAVLATPDNTRRAQLETGRAWVRMQLAANALGVAFHPLSQALQEFPEMAEHYARAHDLLGASGGETVQMLSRLGYAKATPPSPREPLMSKLIEA